MVLCNYVHITVYINYINLAQVTFVLQSCPLLLFCLWGGAKGEILRDVQQIFVALLLKELLHPLLTLIHWVVWWFLYMIDDRPCHGLPGKNPYYWHLLDPSPFEKALFLKRLPFTQESIIGKNLAPKHPASPESIRVLIAGGFTVQNQYALWFLPLQISCVFIAGEVVGMPLAPKIANTSCCQPYCSVVRTSLLPHCAMSYLKKNTLLLWGCWVKETPSKMPYYAILWYIMPHCARKTIHSCWFIWLSPW